MEFLRKEFDRDRFSHLRSLYMRASIWDRGNDLESSLITKIIRNRFVFVG